VSTRIVNQDEADKLAQQGWRVVSVHAAHGYRIEKVTETKSQSVGMGMTPDVVTVARDVVVPISVLVFVMEIGEVLTTRASPGVAWMDAPADREAKERESAQKVVDVYVGRWMRATDYRYAQHSYRLKKIAEEIDTTHASITPEEIRRMAEELLIYRGDSPPPPSTAPAPLDGDED
jgi:hypothetical protein